MKEEPKTDLPLEALSHPSARALVPSSLLASAKSYAEASKAENTRRAYRSDWQQFAAWCAQHSLDELPADATSVALYLAHLAEGGKKPATILRALSSIAEAHRAKGHPSPRATAEVRAVTQGIQRTYGVAPKQKAPLSVGELRAMVKSLPNTLKGCRDRALLLIGFSGGFRRSELVGLNWEDVKSDKDGLIVTLRRGKTDQMGEGRKVGVPYGSDPSTCPVRALRAWQNARGDNQTGPIFWGITRHGRPTGKRLSPADVARVVKASGKRVGLEPKTLGGHSLRAGLVTASARAGKSERAIMAQTGHQSVMMVRRYIREIGIFDDNAAIGIGL